ncbi:short chain dehydrogenase reductase family protein, putative [Ichthyophthirius multifiliis]|uniref:Short chain dehydrogenase reductase family protein, putative n=1 Tax=Ichthyophthirius multifiliis TaxID=5932 RepID=G0QZJ4_ICHMU|nr:short chain dehydrogenase reductase family protein, putative [Ichthyophthirius multifiliis]EGR29355.1 short chain dehydrogenase reductase family protein, putative [Ichthyophthirius multifiliis]|eukprot:XP_004030591.1 short chain dehydrogenase reductase family protein, putative [Ichthyophthirius multifiliis]
MKLDNNVVALVTGGASGLGKATVVNLLSKNVRVFIADMNEKDGNDLVQEYGHERCQFQKTDVSDENQVKSMINACVEAFGAIHFLLNSAGVISAGLLVAGKVKIIFQNFFKQKINKQKNQDKTINTAELERVLKINVVGTFNVSKYVAMQMVKQNYINQEFKERGVIINVASVAGIEGQRGQTVYSASKGAIIGMTLPMARELGSYGIRVCTIAPGIFETPMGNRITEQYIIGLKKASALGRIGQPKEFADAICGLAINSFVTGSVFRIDGGIRLPHM